MVLSEQNSLNSVAHVALPSSCWRIRGARSSSSEPMGWEETAAVELMPLLDQSLLFLLLCAVISSAAEGQNRSLREAV